MIGIVILAAGASTRMGTPKQRLQFENETLLQRSVRVALNSVAKDVIVVLGANANEFRDEFQNSNIHICNNADWHSGMASSIRSGLHQLLTLHPAIEGALLMLCDQPFVSTNLLNQLIQTHQETQSGIVACAYQNTVGAPVLFNRSYFNDLLALSGQEGAKKLLMKYNDKVIVVPFDKGGIDIDTPEDYQRLID